MTNQTNLKHLAMAAMLGLFLGACAHQEGTETAFTTEGEENIASAEFAPLGDTDTANEEASGELAPLPSLGDPSQAPVGNLEELAQATPDNSYAEEKEEYEMSDEAPASVDVGSTLASNDEQSYETASEAPKAEPKQVSKTRKTYPSLTLPVAPVERQNELLNRFYIVRADDTAERVSGLMYGTKDKAADLKAWNPGAWKTGSLIFYLSPLQPADGEMRSFYSERGMVPTEYAVKQGDTLASIALATYGNMDSWKEIGLLNGIQSPQNIEAGRPLALFPADLSGYSLKLESAKSASNSATSVDKQIDSLENQITQLEADIKNDAAAAPSDKEAQQAGIVGSKAFLTSDAETRDLAAIGRERQKSRILEGAANNDGEADLASTEVAAFFKSNLTLVLLFLGALVGFGIFLFVRYARNDSGDV